MKTLRNYLWRDIAWACVATWLALIALFWFFDLLGELDDTGRGRYHLPQAILYCTLLAPGRLYDMLPIGALIGSLLALGKLHATSEYTIMRASGLSPWRIGLALLQGGLIVALCTALLGEWLAPAAVTRANELKLAATNTVLAREFRSGLWIRQANNFVNVKEVTPQRALKGITVYRFDAQRQLTEVRHATSGQAQPQGSWQLREVDVTRITPQTALTTHYPRLDWAAGITPALLTTLMVKPEQMAMRDLLAYIRHLQNNHQQDSRYRAAFWNKAVYPFVSLIMFMLAIPFSASNRRSGGAGMRLLLGILIGLAFFLTNQLAIYTAQQLDTGGPLGALLAPLIFLGIAAILIWRQEKR